MKTIIFMLFIMFPICNGFSQTNDLVYINVKNRNEERLLLYQGKYFLWIENKIIETDTSYNIKFGQYKINNDTIHFFPSKENKLKNNNYVCYCVSKEEKEKQYRLVLKKNQGKHSEDFNIIYSKIFGTLPRNYMQSFESVYFSALKKNNIINIFKLEKEFKLIQ